MTGAMADFLPSLGYLALRAEVGIVPAYISGTYQALPKGATVPKARDLGVAFGPFLDHETLKALTAGMPHQESWRLVAAFVQRVIENLRDGVPNAVDVEAARQAWDGQKLGPIGRGAGRRKRQALRRRLLRSVP